MKLLAKTTAAAGAFVLASGGAALAQTESAPAGTGAIGLSEAVQAAEGAVQGRAYEVEFESEDGRSVYEVEVVDGEERVFEVLVDAMNGEVVSQEEHKLEGVRQRWLNSDELSAVTGSDRSLAEIVAAVEDETATLAREVGVDKENGRVVYEIELIGPDENEVEVEVDPATGEILKRDDD